MAGHMTIMPQHACLDPGCIGFPCHYHLGDSFWFSRIPFFCPPCLAPLWFTLLFQWKTSFSSFVRKGVQGSKRFVALHVLKLSSFCPHIGPDHLAVHGILRGKTFSLWLMSLLLWLPRMLEPEL